MNHLTISYIFWGIMPCLSWLLYFLRKDSHPESRRIIVAIFFLAILIAVPTALIGIYLEGHLNGIIPDGILKTAIYYFIVIALVEETMKYAVVRIRAIPDKEFDEPIDIMMYMVTSAMGFAAIENILYLVEYNKIADIAILATARAFGAILLHALSSAIFGYFVAISMFKPKEKIKYFFTGLFLATFLHGLFNFSIIEISNTKLNLIIPLFILTFLVYMVTEGIKRLKKIKSICQAELEPSQKANNTK